MFDIVLLVFAFPIGLIVLGLLLFIAGIVLDTIHDEEGKFD